MKPKILFLSVLLLLLSYNLKAQNNNTNFENTVNEEFGTLLESLIQSGKIDEVNAKAYLETIFGFDETVSNYLQTTDFSQRLSSLNQENMSSDAFLSNLSSSLISFIPQAQQQAFMNYMEGRMMVQGSMNELLSGQLGTNSINLTAGIIQSIKDNKALKLKNEAIAKKLELITPTLSKLNASNKTYKKLNIIDDCNNSTNWIVNTNPAVIEDADYKRTMNYSEIQNGMLKVSTQNYVTAIFDWEKRTVFDAARFYKNSDKFDFSKDFSMNLYFKMEKRTGQSIILEIAKGYKLYIARTQGVFYLSSPDGYLLTEKYGELKYDNKKIKSEKVFIDNEKSFSHYKMQNYGDILTVVEKKFPHINFDGILKVNISKIGNTFTFKLNDLPYEIKSEVKYFPNKYYLGFLVNATNKKAYIDIDKLELEHL
jgi:hypothetical protein